MLTRVLPIALLAACSHRAVAPTVSNPEPAPKAEPRATPVVAEEQLDEEQLDCPEGTAAVGESWAEIWCARPDGTRHGAYISWDRERRLVARGQFADGVEDGTWFEFFEGTISGEGPYLRGQKHGVWLHRGSGFELAVTWDHGVEIDSIETLAPDEPEPPFDF